MLYCQVVPLFIRRRRAQIEDAILMLVSFFLSDVYISDLF